MLFNSYPFIFFFLPIVLIGFFYLAKLNNNYAITWLGCASLCFYSWLSPQSTPLLIVSILCNFYCGKWISKATRYKKLILVLSLIFNLLGLAFFKYANFFIETINLLNIDALNITPIDIALPIGISFFTFTQIAFLVDSYIGHAKESSLIRYTLFVSYFPHLIAGPVLHHKEMMPQFSNKLTRLISWPNISLGLSIFFIGLFKKTVIADGISSPIPGIFSIATNQTSINFYDAWGAALSYALQIYFDFSGYSDMAIGISLLFGIYLPINFNSPYKSKNIIEFWRRWHITLSRFLKDYLYIPLGGNKRSPMRRYINLLATMILGGFWHGAAWTYLIWGLLHGIYLIINHAWRKIMTTIFDRQYTSIESHWLYSFFTLAITFLACTIAWVFFRAPNLESALNLIGSMLNPTTIPQEWLSKWGDLGKKIIESGYTDTQSTPLIKGVHFLWISLLLGFVFSAPNTQEMFQKYKISTSEAMPNSQTFIQWKMNKLWLVVTVLIATFAILNISELSEFIYFQF